MAALDVGVDELVLGAGLTLVTVALWPSMGRVALIVPGMVLVWIALPVRGAFVARPPATAEKKPERRAS